MKSGCPCSYVFIRLKRLLVQCCTLCFITLIAEALSEHYLFPLVVFVFAFATVSFSMVSGWAEGVGIITPGGWNICVHLVSIFGLNVITVILRGVQICGRLIIFLGLGGELLWGGVKLMWLAS